MATKNTSKRSTAAGRRPAKRTPRRVAAGKPVNKTHETLVRAVARGIVAVDLVGEKLQAAEQHAEQAIARVEHAAEQARKKQTAAAKRLVAQARASARKARARIGEWRTKHRHEERKLKEATGAAELERRKEEAKQKAVAAFTAKWEREWERKMKRTQTRKKAASKKTARKRTAAAPRRRAGAV